MTMIKLAFANATFLAIIWNGAFFFFLTKQRPKENSRKAFKGTHYTKEAIHEDARMPRVHPTFRTLFLFKWAV